MIKFVSLGLIIYIRQHRKSYLVLSDPSQILNKLTNYPPVQDISQIVKLAVQCKDFLACNNEKFKPGFQEVAKRCKEKSYLVEGIGRQTQKLKEKVKSFGFFFKTKDATKEMDTNLEVFSKNTLKNDQILHSDKRILLIDSIIDNISGQIKRRALDLGKLRQAIDQLKALKIQVSLQI